MRELHLIDVVRYGLMKRLNRNGKPIQGLGVKITYAIIKGSKLEGRYLLLKLH